MNNKYLTCFAVILALMAFLTACNEEKEGFTEYRYKNKEEILSESIEKTVVYSDKLKVYFSDDALEKAESIECHADDFSIIEENAEFKIKNDILTIYTENADDVSGLKITVNNYKYFDIRYLDSERYAMLLYTWADDIGMMSEGDEDAYYTDDEKQKQEAREAERLAKINEAFSFIEGVWENEDGTVRLETHKIFDDDGDEFRYVDLYEMNDGEMIHSERVSANAVSIFSESEDYIEIEVIEGRGHSVCYSFKLYNDTTEMDCGLTDERLIKVY